MKVFLLEDDDSLGFGIKTYLKHNNYDVIIATSLEEAKNKFNYDFDLILLDVNLPDGTGFDFLDIFNIENIPIVFLTVNDDDDDIIKGLNLSDDYITKPFKLPILKAKIESILRRTGIKDNKLNYKELVMDLDNYNVFIKGEDINLTLKEFEVLEILFLNKGKIIPRQNIIEKIWDQNGIFIEDNTLSATIKRLRKKLKNYSYVIETIRGIGYRFTNN